MATKDKLTPLRTKHDIDIELDDVIYKVTFKPVNKQIQEKLNTTREKHKDEYEKIDAKRFELKDYLNLKVLNDELLSTYTIDKEVKGGINLEQKTAVLLDNIALVKRISSLEKEIKKLNKDLEDVNVTSEAYYKQMFDECISGNDKVKFQKAIDDAGLSYSLINIHVHEAVRAAQEKK